MGEVGTLSPSHRGAMFGNVGSCGRRNSRHGHRQGRAAEGHLRARHGAACTAGALRRGLPRQLQRRGHADVRAARRQGRADLRARDQGGVGSARGAAPAGLRAAHARIPAAKQPLGQHVRRLVPLPHAAQPGGDGPGGGLGLQESGGALVGCSAGTLNSVKIKGSHLALKSGMLCAEAVFDVLTESFTDAVAEIEELDPTEPRLEAVSYEKRLNESWVHKELFRVRNCHAAFKYGLAPGLAYAGLSTFVTGGREPWTLRNAQRDCDKTEPASAHQPIAYPKPDGVITFDLLSNLQRSGTNHDHDQPSHLVVKPALAAVEDGKNPEGSLKKYGGPETRFCPAGVYEYNDKDELVINAQNCVHCKTCSIKTPNEAIEWCVPEGGGGPAYQVM
eukprot:scaffold1557_cov246-Pinguiococcus_pyrenoidosus.AAC.6